MDIGITREEYNSYFDEHYGVGDLVKANIPRTEKRVQGIITYVYKNGALVRFGETINMFFTKDEIVRNDIAENFSLMETFNEKESKYGQLDEVCKIR